MGGEGAPTRAVVMTRGARLWEAANLAAGRWGARLARNCGVNGGAGGGRTGAYMSAVLAAAGGNQSGRRIDEMYARGRVTRAGCSTLTSPAHAGGRVICRVRRVAESPVEAAASTAPRRRRCAAEAPVGGEVQHAADARARMTRAAPGGVADAVKWRDRGVTGHGAGGLVPMRADSCKCE